MYWCVQCLHMKFVSCKKNLAFGASHMTWYQYSYIYIYIYIYSMPLKALSLSLSHSDSQLESSLSLSLSPVCARTTSNISPYITSDTPAKMRASKNTIIVLMKLVYLPHFNILNFTWTSKSPHMFSWQKDEFSTAMYFLVSSSRHTHTYLYISKNC